MVHRDPFGAPMFVHILVPRRDLEHEERSAANKGFLGVYYANETWAGEPASLRREPAIWFHSHWHEDPLPHPFTADWAAHLRIDEPGEYTFELDTSGPTVLSFDRKRIFETLQGPARQRAAVRVSRGEHLLVVSYLEKSFRGIITLSWQPPNGKTAVIPLNLLSRLPMKDYARLRSALARLRETILASRARPGDEPEEVPVIREKAAEGPGPFSGMKEPRGAAVDERGRLWVADFGNSRLRIFDAFGGSLGGWGGRGDGTFGFRELCAVAIRGDDLYVADTWNGRVQSFTLEGQWKATARDLFGPRGVTVAPDGTVWVTDTGNKRLVAYDQGLKQVRVLGRLGNGPAEFSDPVGIAAGRDGFLYVADAGNQRIQILDATGRFVRQIPMPDWKVGIEPHLDVDRDGTLYVANPPRNALLELEPSGSLTNSYTRDDAGQELSKPTGLSIDRKNRLLYVINSGSDRVSKFKLPERKRQ